MVMFGLVSAFGRSQSAVAALRVGCVAAVLFGVVVAQTPAGTPNAGNPNAGSPTPAAEASASQSPVSQNPVATPTAQEPVPAATQFGRVLTDSVALRCWPSQVASPPVFEDSLTKDEVVQLGETQAGFRSVVLPLGPVGYVSKKFTKTDEQGNVVTVGNDVSFRFRPRTTEAPVDYLADATPLAVVGEEGDWWRARAASVKAWVPEAEVQVVAVDEAVTTAVAKTSARFAKEVEARRAAIEAAKQKAAQDQIDLAAVKVVEDAVAGELKKPTGEQNFDPLNEALVKLDGTLAADSAGKSAVAALKKRIETHAWIAKATAVQGQKAPPATDVQPVLQPKDELERFQAIGWLRYESRFNQPGTYFLEKGGKRLYAVTCNNGRYDLALYLDREVGLMGPRRRPTNANGNEPSLEIERLEVLGSSVAAR
ncbi:MAG: hypothetical protein RL398_2328 [Planctomycetota bacterium]|jgi:hypothetical protein